MDLYRFISSLFHRRNTFARNQKRKSPLKGWSAVFDLVSANGIIYWHGILFLLLCSSYLKWVFMGIA